MNEKLVVFSSFRCFQQIHATSASESRWETLTPKCQISPVFLSCDLPLKWKVWNGFFIFINKCHRIYYKEIHLNMECPVWWHLLTTWHQYFDYVIVFIHTDEEGLGNVYVHPPQHCAGPVTDILQWSGATDSRAWCKNPLDALSYSPEVQHNVS